jgi:holo-[acyl-carrier protein] synthase
MKALGTGYSRGVYWTTIEVVRHHGPPTLQLHAGAAARFAKMGGTRSVVTLTHARDLAIAHVMLLKS